MVDFVANGRSIHETLNIMFYHYLLKIYLFFPISLHVSCIHFLIKINVKPGLHVTFFTPFSSPFKNGLNAVLWIYLHMTLKYIKKIKGAADKDSAKIVRVNVV